MNNVQIADEGVAKLRATIAAAAERKYTPIAVPDLLDILYKLERLAILERHLYNLCSSGYQIYA